jgi:Asp/Glu/hydantoin racemase
MMQRKKLGLVHTSATLVPVFAELCQTHLAGADVFNIVDDSLIKDVIACGELTDSVSQRVKNQVASAEAAGADYILVTCSSIGPAVEVAAETAGVPVLRVDQPMADEAVRIGSRIGVIATLATTLEPTADLVRRRAAAAGKEIELTARLCEGAFAILMSGDAARHDAVVAEALEELAGNVDVIVLAQASMARVVAGLPASDDRPPILSSPPLAINYIASVL